MRGKAISGKTALTRLAVLILLGILAASGGAGALDIFDVRNMLASQIPETVIINMAMTQGGMTLDENEANILRQSGASENLVEALRTSRSEPEVVSSVVDPATARESVTTYVEPPASAPIASSAAMPAEGSAIFPVEVVVGGGHPALFDKEGWLSVSNRDWQTYFLLIDVQKKRMFLSRHPNGGLQIASGENVVLNVRKEGYKLYGDSGEKLTVKIRENLTTTLTLEPFGVFGNSGLTGVAIDRGDVKSEVLFYPYVPQPTVVVERPSVVIEAPPVIFGYPRRHHYYGPPPPRPRHHRRW